MTHEIKIEHKYLYDIVVGKKKFEIRKNDRDYKVGDYVFLNEYENDLFTINFAKVKIIYITDLMQIEGYIVFGFQYIFAVYEGVLI